MQLTALMVQGQTKRSTFFQFTVTFALCTPCALALGWFFAAAGSLLWAFTLAFVSGAFFYIAFSEVIVEEISPWWNQDRGLKVCMLFFSLLIVAGFAFAEENLKNIT
jgi:zinc transporter ZupT